MSTRGWWIAALIGLAVPLMAGDCNGGDEPRQREHVEVPPVPEPGSALLFGAGLALVAARLRR